MTTLLEDVLFDAPDELREKKISLTGDGPVETQGDRR